jgi:Flp pilus assembly protein TadG
MTGTSDFSRRFHAPQASLKNGRPGAYRGQAAILLVLALTAMLGFVALSVDGGLIYSERRHAQNASDASSLAGGAVAALSLENNLVTYLHWNCTDSRITTAKNAAVTAAINRAQDNDFTVDANPADKNGATAVCGQHDNGSYIDKYLDVTTLISHTIDTHFMRLVYTGPMINNVQAVTRVRPRAPLAYGNAIVALRKDCPSSSTGGVHFDGNNQVTVTGGGIFSNACMKAGGSVEVDVSGGSGIACVGDGCYSQSGHPNLSPAPHEGGVQLPEVMQEVKPPDCTSVPSRTVDSETIDPGRYAEIRLTNGETLTLNPGLYCINSLTMNGGTLKGEGVTIYVRTGDFAISGGEINLSAPPARASHCSYCPPPLPGVLVFLAPGNTGEVVLLGNAVSNYTGLVYAPNGTIEVGGTAGEYSPINAQLVADTVFIHGNAEVVVNFDDEVNPQVPAMLELFK